jgi:hypothetical protein
MDVWCYVGICLNKGGLPMQHRSRLPRGQTSPYALAIGASDDEACDHAPRSQPHRGKRQPRGPPLPPTVAIAYSVADAVKVSGLSRSSIYNLIGEGKLRSALVAGRRLIPAAALCELLQGAE